MDNHKSNAPRERPEAAEAEDLKKNRMNNNKSNAPQERLEAVQAVPEAPASFADFTFQLETGDEGTFFNFEAAADVADVNELFRDDELCFNFEGADFEETPATKSNSLSDHVMHWEKKDGAEFMRREQIRWIDDEASASAAASASASAAAIETLAVSMSASLPQNESASYEDKYELYRMLQQQKIEERQLKQMCLSTTPISGVRLIETPVEVDGVMYEPLDPDYEELIARAISKPMPIPTSPNSPKRRYAARRLRVSPITSARGGEVDPEDSDDKDFDDDFDEGVFHMSLPADHIPLDPNTPYISMMPGNRKRLFESMGVPAV